MIVESKDVDLLVKVGAVYSSYFQQDRYFKMIFIDKNQVQYYSEIKNTKINLEKDQVCKLRSVMVRAVENSFSVDFFNYSEILLIPSRFKDAQELLESTAQCSISQKSLEQQTKNEIHLEKYQKEQINQYTSVYHSKKQTVNLFLLKDFSFQFEILKFFSMKSPLSMNSVTE